MILVYRHTRASQQANVTADTTPVRRTHRDGDKIQPFFKHFRLWVVWVTHTAQTIAGTLLEVFELFLFQR